MAGGVSEGGKGGAPPPLPTSRTDTPRGMPACTHSSESRMCRRTASRGRVIVVSLAFLLHSASNARERATCSRCPVVRGLPRMAAAGSSASKISLVTRNRLSRRRVLLRRDDNASCRSLPAAKGHDLGMLGQRGVDDAALGGIHRFEFNLASARDTLGRPVCEFFQRHAPSLAV